MKENRIEEIIKQLELILKVRKEQREIIECAGGSCMNCDPDIKALTESIKIVPDYKRVLKENEELKDKNKTLEELLQGTLYEMYKYYRDLANSYQANCISKEKVKDKIEYLEDYIEENSDEQGYWGNINTDVIYGQIGILEEILKESEE